MAKIPPMNVDVYPRWAYEGPADSNFIPCPDTGGWTGKFICPHITMKFSEHGSQERVRCAHAERTLEGYKSHWMGEHWRPPLGLPAVPSSDPYLNDPKPQFRRGDPDDQELTETYVMEGYEDDVADVQGFVFSDTLRQEFLKQGTSGYPVVFRTPDLEEWVPHRIRTLQETKITVIDLSLREH